MLGVEKGLEKASKVMMPLLFIFLIIVVVKSLTLDGAIDGVRYILTTSRRYFNGRYSICVRSVILYVIIGNNWDDYLCKLCAKRNDNKVIAISIVIMNILVSVLVV